MAHRKANPGRHKPFLYTLSEPIGTRSWIPLQDTPQVRATYTAHIHTSSNLLAVMSAKNDPKAKRNGEYSFDMPDAIPSYLIALAVGDLRFKETGPRTGVYAERSLLSAAAKEFADAEAHDSSGREAVRTVSLGSVSTSWWCRRAFPSAAWRIRGCPSSPRRPSPGTRVSMSDRRRAIWRTPGREIW